MTPWERTQFARSAQAEHFVKMPVSGNFKFQSVVSNGVAGAPAVPSRQLNPSDGLFHPGWG